MPPRRSVLATGRPPKKSMAQRRKSTMPGNAEQSPGNQVSTLKVGDPIWYRDPELKQSEVFAKATVTAIADEEASCEVRMADGSSETKAIGEVFAANTTDDLVGDNTALVFLNEPTILHNVTRPVNCQAPATCQWRYLHNVLLCVA